jgi:molybdopterin synthase catalytic subunit
LPEADVRAEIVDRPIDTAALTAEVAGHHNGATVLFIGTVREVNDGREVSGMEYTAYHAMAARELEAIVAEAANRFGTSDFAVEHRVGELALGEASVAIAVAHPHRGAAYDASRYVIEQLKARVPIWKLEHYVDGTREWVDPTRDGRRAMADARETEGARG